MKINKKLCKKSIIAGGILAITTIGVLAGGTFSKYYTKIDGTGNAQIAQWSFKANNTSTTMTNIQLSNTYSQSILKQKTIAPGTSGSFDIVLDATGADVAIDYAITFDNLQNKPKNMKFTYGTTTGSSLKDLENVLKGQISLSDPRTKTITINWAWDYQTGTSASDILANDQKDTEDSGKNFTFDITITGTQVKPQA